MATHKNIDKICCVILALTIVIAILFVNSGSLGVVTTAKAKEYESRLFDTSSVHSINIVMDNWDDFIANCTDEEYRSCSIVIDGELYKNVAIRAKGNTSLSEVSQYGNNRYSFKIEFDKYNSTENYHGLDKLNLNNIIQDNTYMKDYLSYQMMNYFGVSSPLCSYSYITVNDNDWGLYLAVEGVEESFLERNYGSDYDKLYKPDSMSFGNIGTENKDMPEMPSVNASDTNANGNIRQNMFPNMENQNSDSQENIEQPPDFNAQNNTDGDTQIFNMQPPDSDKIPTFDGSTASNGKIPNIQLPDNMQNSEDSANANITFPDNTDTDVMNKIIGGMGSSDVSLIYTDNEYSSYDNIFDNAKTKINDNDKDRLISSIKQMNENQNIEEVVDIDKVIRYFVVHNFVCNADSYTGSMIHNYYLYEKDGQMSMIPWDYNLAFGGFNSSENATSLVNSPIDSPVSNGTTDSRPMLAWILNNEEYTEEYHRYFSDFIERYFDSGYFSDMISKTENLISSYVEKDPTKFCTYDEFKTGVNTLKTFCLLRAESIKGQLNGNIPSDTNGQNQNSSSLVDASSIKISDMGSMKNKTGNDKNKVNINISDTNKWNKASMSDIPSMQGFARKMQ